MGIKRFSRKNKLNKSNKKKNRAVGKGTRKHKDGKLTRENWMKKLIFKGGSGAAEHGVSVFGDMNNQHVGNSGAIHVNQFNSDTVKIDDMAKVTHVDPAVQVQEGGKKRKSKGKTNKK